jgi:magnesium transporter
MSGVTLASAMFVKLLLIDRLEVMVALVVALTLVVVVLVAKTVGCILPILSKKVGLDPAVMSAPIITTIVDAMSLLIYFTIATAVLGL